MPPYRGKNFSIAIAESRRTDSYSSRVSTPRGPQTTTRGGSKYRGPSRGSSRGTSTRGKGRGRGGSSSSSSNSSYRGSKPNVYVRNGYTVPVYQRISELEKVEEYGNTPESKGSNATNGTGYESDDIEIITFKPEIKKSNGSPEPAIRDPRLRLRLENRENEQATEARSQSIDNIPRHREPSPAHYPISSPDEHQLEYQDPGRPIEPTPIDITDYINSFASNRGRFGLPDIESVIPETKPSSPETDPKKINGIFDVIQDLYQLGLDYDDILKYSNVKEEFLSRFWDRLGFSSGILMLGCEVAAPSPIKTQKLLTNSPYPAGPVQITRIGAPQYQYGLVDCEIRSSKPLVREVESNDGNKVDEEEEIIEVSTYSQRLETITFQGSRMSEEYNNLERPASRSSAHTPLGAWFTDESQGSSSNNSRPTSSSMNVSKAPEPKQRYMPRDSRVRSKFTRISDTQSYSRGGEQEHDDQAQGAGIYRNGPHIDETSYNGSYRDDPHDSNAYRGNHYRESSRGGSRG